MLEQNGFDPLDLFDQCDRHRRPRISSIPIYDVQQQTTFVATHQCGLSPSSTGLAPFRDRKDAAFPCFPYATLGHRPAASWGGLYSDHPSPSTAIFKKNTYPTKWG